MELVGYFQWNGGWDLWEQVADEYKDEHEGIVPLYRISATTGATNER